MKRTNARGEDDPGWVRITWDEAMSTIAEKLQETIDRYGGEAIFGMSGTSRIWGMFAYGALGQLVGSPNMCIPWQVCKGPRFFATAMNSMMQASWMETVGRPKVYTSWGTGPELSNYDDSCRTVVDVAEKADTHIIVDPRMTNLGKEADIWLNLRPGTDGAMAMGWLNILINNELYDDLFAKKWTNGPFLVCNDVEPSGYETYRFTRGKFNLKTRLLKESDLKEDGDPHKFMVWDNLNNRMTYFDADSGLWEGETWSKPTAGHEGMQEHLVPGVSQGWVPDPTPFDPEIDPALYGEFEVELKDGKKSKVTPVWQLFTDRVAEYTPEKVSEITGVPAETIKEACLIHAKRIDPSTGYGNGGIQYQLAIEHSCNAIAMCRAMDTYIGLSGNWDVPAGHRGGTQGDFVFKAGLGAVAPGIPNISAEEFNKTLGIEDYPLLGWWQGWADDASVWKAIETGNPYPVKAGWCSTGDFMCMSNSLQKWRAFPNLDFFVCEDLWKTPTAGMADILLPAQHWLETDCPRMSQGPSGGQGATVRAIEPPADTKHDIEIATMIYQYMGKQWGPDDNKWPDRIENLDIMLNTGRQGAPTTWEEYRDDFEQNGWKDAKVVAPDTWGTYRRYETGMMPLKAYGDKEALVEFGKPGFGTPTRKMEIWSTLIETFMPDDEEDFLPTYKEPPLEPDRRPGDEREVPVHRHHRPPHPGVLPQRASPAAVVPRDVAGAAHRDQPAGCRALGHRTGRLGVDRERQRQDPPGVVTSSIVRVGLHLLKNSWTRRMAAWETESNFPMISLPNIPTI